MGWVHLLAAIYAFGALWGGLLTHTDNVFTPAPYDKKPVWLFALLWWVSLLGWAWGSIENALQHRRGA